MKKSLLLILFLFFLIACEERTDSGNSSLDEVLFTVDRNLLGNKIINETNSIEFYVPKLLTQSENNFKSIEDQLNAYLTEEIDFTLQYVWTDSMKENSLLVSKIILPAELINDPIENYSELLRNTGLYHKAAHTKFLKDGMVISQFITNHNNYVIIKIIFQPRETKLIQFDYIFNKENYKQEVRSIESSIGSIKTL